MGCKSVKKSRIVKHLRVVKKPKIARKGRTVTTRREKQKASSTARSGAGRIRSYPAELTIRQADSYTNFEIFHSLDAARNHQRRHGGQIYTQVDAGDDRMYSKGVRTVNRTGVYGVLVNRRRIPIKRKGALTKHGYSVSHSEEARRKALDKAVKEYGSARVWRMLHAQVQLREKAGVPGPKPRREVEAQWRRFRSDREWVKAKYKPDLST